MRLGEAGRGGRRRFRHRQAHVRRDQDRRPAEARRQRRLTEQDDLLALGVVPIAITDWFGGEPFGVWPWAPPKLGGAAARGAQPRRRHPGRPDRAR